MCLVASYSRGTPLWGLHMSQFEKHGAERSFSKQQKETNEPGLVAHVCNPAAQDTKAG